jgi:hypothetical protein
MIKQLSILLITVLSVSSTAVRASEAAETADAIAAVAAFEAAKATEAENAVAAFRELEAMADICLTGALEHLEANPWQLSQEHVEDLRTMLLAKLEPVAQQIVQEQVAQEPAVTPFGEDRGPSSSSSGVRWNRLLQWLDDARNCDRGTIMAEHHTCERCQCNVVGS